MKHNNNGTDGFRIAWFIPIEMFMSWVLMTLVIVGHPALAAASFAFVFVPSFYLLNKYLPQPVYYYSLIKPAPKPDEYDMTNSKSAEQYSLDLDEWLIRLGDSWKPNGAAVDHYERKPLPRPFETLFLKHTTHKTVAKLKMSRRDSFSAVSTHSLT